MNSNWKFGAGIDYPLNYGAAFTIIKNMAYKVVETSMVTDEELERILNEWTAKGYAFASIQFVNAVSSKRPVMAFLFFTTTE